MLSRLEAFYILSERYRKTGPTEKQMQAMKETGYPFSYRVELHKCLKKLLVNVINQTNPKVQKLYVQEVYSWLLQKLMQMGALSRSEQMQDASYLNPLASTMGSKLNQVIKQKLLYNLIDPVECRKNSMAMFEEPDWCDMLAERTAHKEIPPASIRIQSVKTRGLRNLNVAVDAIH